jgi:hypothetical protein
LCPVLHSFLGKGKLRPYYKIRLLEQECVLKIVAFMKQKNMVWQLKHKFIIPNLESPFLCCRPKILFSFKIRCDWAPCTAYSDRSILQALDKRQVRSSGGLVTDRESPK